jgi:hypothetical protein
MLPVVCIGVKLENMVLKNIFGPEGVEMAGSCRKIHDEKLCNLCY